MARQAFQAEVVQPEVQPAGEFHGAHDRVDGQHRSGEFGFGDQKRVVEGRVMGHQGAPVHQVGDVGGDIGERGLILQHLSRQTVHMGRSRIDSRVEQADDRMLDSAVGVQRQRRDAEHTGLARTEARGFDVDDEPAVIGLASGAAPGLAHRTQDCMPDRQHRSHPLRVGRHPTASEYTRLR